MKIADMQITIAGLRQGLEIHEAENKDLRELVDKLQRALAFWLPDVPADDDEIADRAGEDSWLLVGNYGEPEPSAQELGWINLRNKHPACPALPWVAVAFFLMGFWSGLVLSWAL